MTIIPPHNLDGDNHLNQVLTEMAKLGAPVIRAVWLEGFGAWLALEGSHRLVAAHQLGLTPEIEPVEYDPDAMTDDVIPGSFDDNHSLESLVDNAWRIRPIQF